MRPRHVFIGLAICALVLFGLHYGTFWPQTPPKSCIYRPLKGRFCDEFPHDDELTVLGAKWATLSSLMFVFGGVAATQLLYARIEFTNSYEAELLATNIFFVWLGIASFMYHSTHCKWWWRADINTVRAFPFVLTLTVLFLGIPPHQHIAVHIFKFAAISSTPFIFMGAYWHNTESSATILVVGATALCVALVCLKIKLKDHLSNFIFYALVLCLASGGGFIVSQSAPTFCFLQPVAIGHTILGFVPPLLALVPANPNDSNSGQQKNELLLVNLM